MIIAKLNNVVAWIRKIVLIGCLMDGIVEVCIGRLLVSLNMLLVNFKWYEARIVVHSITIVIINLILARVVTYNFSLNTR